MKAFAAHAERTGAAFSPSRLQTTASKFTVAAIGKVDRRFAALTESEAVDHLDQDGSGRPAHARCCAVSAVQ